MKDAMRYRWLRDTQNKSCRDQWLPGSIDSLMVSDGDFCATAPNGSDFDRAIDRAMEKYALEHWGAK